MGKMRPFIDSIGCVCEIFAELSRCVLPFAVGSRRVARMNGFSVVGGAYDEGRRGKDVTVHRDHCHPVIQTAPQA